MLITLPLLRVPLPKNKEQKIGTLVILILQDALDMRGKHK